MPFSHSFHSIVLSRALFTSLKDAVWDVNIIYMFYKFFCIFCANKKIIKLLSSVADWDVAGVLHGMEIPVDPQSWWQHSFITQTLPYLTAFNSGIGRPEDIVQPVDPAPKIWHCSHWMRQSLQSCARPGCLYSAVWSCMLNACCGCWSLAEGEGGTFLSLGEVHEWLLPVSTYLAIPGKRSSKSDILGRET